MQKSTKIGILIIAFLIIFYVLIITLLINKKNDYDYLVLNNDINFAYNNNNFFEVKDNDIENEKEYFSVYVEGINIGKYNLKKGKVWNFFDKNNNFKYNNDYFIATNASENIEVQKYSKRDLSLSEKIMVKNNLKINLDQNQISGYAYDLDLDNDNINESIIKSSYNEIGENMKLFYNIIFVIKKNRIYKIIENYGENANNNYNFKGAIKLKNQKNSFIVIQTIENPSGDIESYKEKSSIYSFDKKKYQKV